jgi:hypothetical protein
MENGLDEFPSDGTPKGCVLDHTAITNPPRLTCKTIQPAKVKSINNGGIEVKALTEMVEVAAACETRPDPTGIGQSN